MGVASKKCSVAVKKIVKNHALEAARIVVFVLGGSCLSVLDCRSRPISPIYWGCNRSLFKDIFDIVLFIFLGQTTSEDKYYRTRRR
jgi:hypothetical protein